MRGRRWKKGGREEWRLRGDLGDLGGKGELEGDL